MDRRTTGIIATLATTLLCGLPGLIVFCTVPVIAFLTPVQSSGSGGNIGPRAPIFLVLTAMCLGVIFIAIPVIVGVVTLGIKPKEEFPSMEAEPEVEAEAPSEAEEDQSASEAESEPEGEAEAISDEEGDTDEELPDPLG